MQLTTQHIILVGESLEMHPYRALYWKREKVLFLADLHLGKVQHFRREGIPLPQDIINTNWDKLIALLLEYQPVRVIFLGDLFHSDYNAEWEEFCDLLDQFPTIQFDLILGNHDSLSDRAYARSVLRVFTEPYLFGPFTLSHHPIEEPEGGYNLAGHVHPAVRLEGGGRQRLRLPCFVFGKESAILPAFGVFTGSKVLTPSSKDQVFVVTDEAVIRVG